LSAIRYAEFLDSKRIVAPSHGLDIALKDINPALFPFQRDIVRWALRKGRAAIFADTGLGKTIMQIEWARHIPGDVLILAPLAVSNQTIREGAKFNIAVNICRCQADAKPGINITNYEMLNHFNPGAFAGVVLDESSILKAYNGKTRTAIIKAFQNTPFRLACTATPSPNDYMELGNHSEFLGLMSRSEMLAMFFIHDGGNTSKWRLKGHAQDKFWGWLASWASVIRKPSDLGYSDEGFVLPPLHVHQHTVEVDKPTEGHLFAIEALTLRERQKARRDTMEQRAKCAANIIAEHPNEPWLIWCGLNKESEILAREIPGAVEVRGSDDREYKEKTLLGFAFGNIQKLITKPTIAGFGMNWQHCAKMIFVGLSDSFEQYYQAVRRCYRFGQDRPVDVHIVTAETEGAVMTNIKRKEQAATLMAETMVNYTKEYVRQDLRSTERRVSRYEQKSVSGDGWELRLGDCVEEIRNIPDNSIHYSIFSPPFSSLYTYTNSERDMGNCKTDEEFLEHFRYLVEELYRVIIPGRLVSFHCMDIPAMKERDGYIGLKDFPGDLIRVFQDIGFIYHSRVVIWKDPLIEATRTKALGLMHKQLVKDSAMCRQGLPDYLITMRKPGNNPNRIAHPNGLTSYIGQDEPSLARTDLVYSHHVWRRYASPVWMDINQSNTLQKEMAKGSKDERHICPLQLDVIERALELWSNPGDTILSPFAGIGSEGYVSLKTGRRFRGIELKRSYWQVAANNLQRVADIKQQTILDFGG